MHLHCQDELGNRDNPPVHPIGNLFVVECQHTDQRVRNKLKLNKTQQYAFHCFQFAFTAGEGDARHVI